MMTEAGPTLVGGSPAPHGPAFPWHGSCRAGWLCSYPHVPNSSQQPQLLQSQRKFLRENRVYPVPIPSPQRGSCLPSVSACFLPEEVSSTQRCGFQSPSLAAAPSTCTAPSFFPSSPHPPQPAGTLTGLGSATSSGHTELCSSALYNTPR